MIIAIDFDGTCVTHEYPYIGKDIGAVPVLKKIVESGNKLILNTMRCDDRLKDAINWFKKNNIELWSVNCNPDQKEWTTSPKCYAHIYIDDAALGAPLVDEDEVGDVRPYIDWEYAEMMLEKMGII